MHSPEMDGQGAGPEGVGSPGGQEVDAEVHAAMNGIRRIVRALRLSSRAAEKALGVSGAQLFVLQQLAEVAARADAAPSIAQLADLTATDPSSVSVVVSRLVAHGLAARRSSKADARRAEVVITPAGRALLRRAPSPVQYRMLDSIAKLPHTRRRELIGGLEAIVAALGVTDQAASMFFEEEGESSQRSKGDSEDGGDAPSVPPARASATAIREP
jgi:DNA-binding MarR family transcriptional regulator